MDGSKFRSYEPEQVYLLPPRIDEWLPEGHLAYFIRDVVQQLDLRAIYEKIGGDEGGRPAYDPRMMVGLLLYAYSVGTVSSRKIERGTHESVPFRVLAADQHPDHDTIASFRKRHLEALAGLFKQVLRMCQKAGLVKLGHVALDGTKVKANASKHKAMSYERMLKSEKELEVEIAQLLKRAQAQDQAEDVHDAGAGDDLPSELRFKRSRLAKIHEAKEALEREAREKGQKAAVEKGDGEGRPGRGEKKAAQAVPEPKAQRNFTDADSRIMLDNSTKSFQQCYNCQAAVDEKAQVIVAAEVTQDANDKHQLAPMAQQIKKNNGGRLPRVLSADSGYFTTEHIEAVENKTDLHVATGKVKKGEAEPATRGRPPAGLSKKDQMARKLRTKAGRAVYSKRKEIVEPVFGQTKETRGFRRFSFRGLEYVRQEWQLVCSTHNLLKLFRSGCALC